MRKFSELAITGLTVCFFSLFLAQILPTSSAYGQTGSVHLSGVVPEKEDVNAFPVTRSLNVFGEVAGAQYMLSNNGQSERLYRFIVKPKGDLQGKVVSQRFRATLGGKQRRKILVRFMLESKLDQSHEICVSSRTSKVQWSSFRCEEILVTRLDLM